MSERRIAERRKTQCPILLNVFNYILLQYIIRTHLGETVLYEHYYKYIGIYIYIDAIFDVQSFHVQSFDVQYRNHQGTRRIFRKKGIAQKSHTNILFKVLQYSIQKIK
jgi:hypothetical protein